MRGSINIGKILGIPIQLHVSWFLIAVLITWTLAAGYFPQEYPGWSPTNYWLVGAFASFLFFASVLIHELGHSVLALREEVPVKNITDQVQSQRKFLLDLVFGTEDMAIILGERPNTCQPG